LVIVADWRPAKVVDVVTANAHARVLRISVPGWPGNEPGQHVDVRLTAEDGYQAVRPYSLSDIVGPQLLEITVEEVVDGEVSPYLVRTAQPGDRLEARGPVGEWFTWDASVAEPVQLIGGGSGVVPLMAMLRAHRRAASPAPMRLLYSVRSPAMAYYREELALAPEQLRAIVRHVYTRDAPAGYDRSVGRLTPESIAEAVLPAQEQPRVYLCGPDAFVDAVAEALLVQGHPYARIRTERFG